MQLRFVFRAPTPPRSSSRREEQMAYLEVAVVCAEGRTDEWDCVSTPPTPPQHPLLVPQFSLSGSSQRPGPRPLAGGATRHIISLAGGLLMDSRAICCGGLGWFLAPTLIPAVLETVGFSLPRRGARGKDGRLRPSLISFIWLGVGRAGPVAPWFSVAFGPDDRVGNLSPGPADAVDGLFTLRLASLLVFSWAAFSLPAAPTSSQQHRSLSLCCFRLFDLRTCNSILGCPDQFLSAAGDSALKKLQATFPTRSKNAGFQSSPHC